MTVQRDSRSVELEPQAHHELRQAALAYIERGWPVLPVWWTRNGICACPRGPACPEKTRGKHPMLRHGVHDASVEYEDVSRWWMFQRANIAIATGPSRLLVVDVDPRHGGNDQLEELFDVHGPFPRTHTVATGGGGHHYYFRRPCDRHFCGKLAVGIDVKHSGGCVIAPPSRHASGRAYRLAIDAEVAAPPEWLIEKATKPPVAIASIVSAANVELRGRLRILLRTDRELAELWENLGGRHPDQSRSGYDLAIAHALRRRKVPQAETVAGIAARPGGHRPGDLVYAARTVAMAYSAKGRPR